MANVSASYAAVGLNLIAGAQIGGVSPQVTYVAIGTGAGALSSGVTSGTPITSLSVAALPAAIPGNQVLVIIYQTNIDYVTVSAAGAALGATSIPLASWTPSYSYPAGSGLLNMPALSDTQLQAETDRFAVAAATAGVNPGETLISGYGDPIATPSGTYIEAGFFGGPTASATPGSGTLIARAAIWWAHVQNQDSAMPQLDGTI